MYQQMLRTGFQVAASSSSADRGTDLGAVWESAERGLWECFATAPPGLEHSRVKGGQTQVAQCVTLSLSDRGPVAQAVAWGELEAASIEALYRDASAGHWLALSDVLHSLAYAPADMAMGFVAAGIERSVGSIYTPPSMAICRQASPPREILWQPSDPADLLPCIEEGSPLWRSVDGRAGDAQDALCQEEIYAGVSDLPSGEIAGKLAAWGDIGQCLSGCMAAGIGYEGPPLYLHGQPERGTAGQAWGLFHEAVSLRDMDRLASAVPGVLSESLQWSFREHPERFWRELDSMLQSDEVDRVFTAASFQGQWFVVPAQ
jgi:hypothetical protein